jgi:signal transduction histidine kinase
MAQLPLRVRIFAVVGGLSALPVIALPLLGVATPAALWLLPVMLMLAYSLAAVVAGPADALLDAARRIQAGDLKARAVLVRNADLGLIAGVLFGLADQLEYVTRTLEDQVGERTAALARKADQLRAVGQVGQQVAAVLEPDVLLHFVVRVMRGTFGYDGVAVLQRHGEHLVLTACAVRAMEEVPLGRAFSLVGPDAPPLAGHARGEGGIASAVSPLVGGLHARAELAVPIRLGDRVLGVLVVQSTRANSFDAEDLFTVRTIAGQVAVALENARLFEAERQLRDLAVTEERNRMAREIHDTLAQGFMGIIMQLRAMHGAADSATARFHREQAEALARESLHEARRSVWNLRPLRLEGKGLTGALAAEVEGVERRAGLRATLETEGDTDRLPPPVEAGLLRIAQEALHNTVKHGQASHVMVRLVLHGPVAELAITDDGVGFALVGGPVPTASGGGFGLGGMAERARLLGGQLLVDSAPGAGCRVTVRLPLVDSGRRP